MQADSVLPPPPATAVKPSDEASFLDPSFVSQLLGSVDVDQNDPLILAALAQLGASASESSNAEANQESKDEESKKRKDSDRD